MSAGYVRSNLLVLNGGAGVDESGGRKTARQLDLSERASPGEGQSRQTTRVSRTPPRQLNLESPGSVANGREPLHQARGKGYEGEACGDCGNFTLVRNGTCMKCVTCGATSGCS